MNTSTLFRVRKVLFSNKLSIFGLIIVSAFFVLSLLYSLLGNLIVPYNPNQINLQASNLAPSFSHLFGTDSAGRDLFSRVIAALPVDIGIPLAIVLISVGIGLFLGTVAGYFRGFLEEIIMRVTDMFLAFPPIIMALAVAATLGHSLVDATVAIVFVWWPPYVRLVRGSVLEVTSNDFITASKTLNSKFPYVLRKGIVPNIISTVVIYATMDIGTALLTLSTLGFLSIGIPPGVPELGSMASTLTVNFYQYQWEGLIPAFFILLIVLGFGLLGEGLREGMDVQLRSHIIFRKHGLSVKENNEEITSAQQM